LKEKHGLRRAACLLFGANPEKFVSGAWIKIGFFVTNDDLRYQDEVHGSLFEQVEETLKMLHTKYLKAYITYQGLQRRETFLFPYAALREVLLNAIVHKDYSRRNPIQISVYENRIVFWNAGILLESWTLKKFLGKHPSEPFNPLIANAFFRAGYIEAWGRGIEKISLECRSNDIEPPIYDIDATGVMVTFHANPTHIQTAGKSYPGNRTAHGTDRGELGEKLGETRAAIVQLMRQDAKISTKTLAENLGLSTTAVDKNIQFLKAQGHIQRIGPAKGGHWEILK
jgi:ATP-dependent DNA helicase RecG